MKRNKLTNIKKKKIVKYSTPLSIDKVNWNKVEKIFNTDKSWILRKWKKEKNSNPRNSEVLSILAGGAVIALSFAFPTLPLALAPLFIDKDKYNQRRLKYSVDRLKKQKLVKVVEENGQTVVRITEAGRKRALRYKLEEMKVKTPKRWDRKWRLVIFDIPEKYKRVREIFRHHLKIMGFYPLQKSVWIHAYPCFNEIEFLREIYHVGINVTYIVAEKIEGAKDLRKHFQLK